MRVQYHCPFAGYVAVSECPFCGRVSGKKSAAGEIDGPLALHGWNDEKFFIACPCGASTRAFDTVTQAWQAWNTRAILADGHEDNCPFCGNNETYISKTLACSDAEWSDLKKEDPDLYSDEKDRPVDMFTAECTECGASLIGGPYQDGLHFRTAQEAISAWCKRSQNRAP